MASHDFPPFAKGGPGWVVYQPCCFIFLKASPQPSPKERESRGAFIFFSYFFEHISSYLLLLSFPPPWEGLGEA
jgi:hypothetical protein